MYWGVFVAVVVTVIVAGVLTRVAPLDHPRPRGNHDRPTATSGGLAVIAGTMAGLLLFLVLDQPPPGLGRVPYVLAGGCLVAFLGALDDVWDFPPVVKLVTQILVSVSFCIFVARVEVLPVGPNMELTLGPVLGVIGTSLWLVVMMNAYNFMDGSDGLAIGVQSIGLFTLSLINPDRPIIAFTLLAAAVANIVFLPFNHPGRRLFQGDTGALFCSFLIAAATVLHATGPDPRASLYMGVFVAAPFLTDVLLTLQARARAGRRLFEAHNEHLYQRWLRAGNRSAAALAWRVWGLTALSAAIGFAVERWAPGLSLSVLLSVFAALATLWIVLDREVGPIEPSLEPTRQTG